MKIKTIRRQMDYAEAFDKEVNDALEKGWTLVKRCVLQGYPLYDDLYVNRMLYAELVLPDPPAEPEPIDPVNLLRQVQEFCLNVPPHICKENCPLFGWCNRYAGETDPADWDLPEVADA